MNEINGPHQNQSIAVSGVDFSKAKAVMIMIHGRGASAQSILELSKEFTHTEHMTFIAPQASDHTWYPYSFLAPREHNQPGINSGLQAISDIIANIEKNGIPKERIFLLGFSQGACLASEFVVRNPAKYAGLVALSGGLIGEEIDWTSYSGDLEGTPYFIGCSDIDPHIPVQRVDESEAVFKKLGASVTKNIYPGMGHLVNQDEIDKINAMIATELV